MNENYQYTFFSIPFSYEIGADELIIRSIKKERRVAWVAITKAVYLAPTKKPSFWMFLGRPSQMLRALPFIFVLDALKDQGTLFVLSGDQSKIDKVFLDEADPQAKLMLEALKEHLKPVWQPEASTLREAYHSLGVPPEVERLLWLPRITLILFILSLILVSLIGASPIFLYLGVLTCLGAVCCVVRLILDVSSYKKHKRAMRTKGSVATLQK